MRGRAANWSRVLRPFDVPRGHASRWADVALLQTPFVGLGNAPHRRAQGAHTRTPRAIPTTRDPCALLGTPCAIVLLSVARVTPPPSPHPQVSFVIFFGG